MLDAVDTDVAAGMNSDNVLRHERSLKVLGAQGAVGPEMIRRMADDDATNITRPVLAYVWSNGLVTEPDSGIRVPQDLISSRKCTLARLSDCIGERVGTGVLVAEVQAQVTAAASEALTHRLQWQTMVKLGGGTPANRTYAPNPRIAGVVNDSNWGCMEAKEDARAGARLLGSLLYITLVECAGLPAGDSAADPFGLAAFVESALAKQIPLERLHIIMAWMMTQLAGQVHAFRTKPEAPVPDFVAIVASAGVPFDGAADQERQRLTVRSELVAALQDLLKSEADQTGKAMVKRLMEGGGGDAARETGSGEEKPPTKRARQKAKAKLLAADVSAATPAAAAAAAAVKLAKATAAAGGALAVGVTHDQRLTAAKELERLMREPLATGGLAPAGRSLRRDEEPCPWKHLFGTCKPSGTAACPRCVGGAKPTAAQLAACKAAQPAAVQDAMKC